METGLSDTTSARSGTRQSSVWRSDGSLATSATSAQLADANTIRRHASFSACRRYRWTLSRWWDNRHGGPWIGWIMLNPSTADARQDDPTIRRCIGFSRAWGFSGCRVCNLYALRSKTPRGLWRVRDPIGAGNDRAIRELVGKCSVIV